jgi:FkbM family methyltransferase
MAELSTRSKISIAKSVRAIVMAGRRLAGRTNSARVTRRRIEWDLDLAEGIDFAIYLLGGFEVRTLKLYERLIKPGDVVLDIGANIGAHTLPLAALAGPCGRVIAFEPTKYAYEKLRRNLAINPQLADRVTAIQCALLASLKAELPEEIYSSWPLDQNESLHAVHGGRLCSTSGATISTLDSSLERLGVDRVDFVKLDVDGHEADVLLGGGDVLRRFRPSILMEWAPACAWGKAGQLNSMLGLLEDVGYEFMPFGAGRPRPLTTEALAQLVGHGGSVNVLLQCRPDRW